MRRLVTLGVWTVGALAFVVVLIAVGTFLFMMSRQTIADITVQNRSGEVVVNGEVEFLGNAYSFSDIGVGQTAHISFPVRGEGGYRIRARIEIWQSTLC